MILKRNKSTFSKKLVNHEINENSIIMKNKTIQELIDIINNPNLQKKYNDIPEIAYETDEIYILQDSCSDDVKLNTSHLILFDMEAMDDDTDNLVVWDSKDDRPKMFVDNKLEDITKTNLIKFYNNNYYRYQLDADWEQEFDKPKIKRDGQQPGDKEVIDYTNLLISTIKNSNLEL